jgi:pheophorbide a oxygenase
MFVTACSLLLVWLSTSVAFSVQKRSPDVGLYAVSTGRQEMQNPHGAEEDLTDNIRPLHQNWWPVAALTSLKPSQPNALQVLGKPLVAAKFNDSSWSVLDDRCSHRFAPLSEGRMVSTGHLQCAYHGWEFDTATGVCSKLPQITDENKVAAVQTYPTREEAGMLWVWMDPSSLDLADQIHLPISPLLRHYVARFGNEACFMRDLPYGIELLGENLLDLSHLPFSHHSVGGLKREQGGPLPTRMLSKREREDAALWEKEEDPTYNPVLPRYQAEVIDAAQHDPLMMRFAKSGVEMSTRIGYYDPCHVRYRRKIGERATHVELFMCPVSEGRSRVFLFNVFKSAPVPKVADFRGWLKQIAPGALKAKLFQSLFLRRTDPRKPYIHLVAHDIFDGDGIFLHKQGNLMREAGLTFRDYSTPSSADTLLLAYRRFIESAARKTRETSSGTLADAVDGQKQYGDDLPRSVMLDRYNTHTKHCPTCLASLQKLRRSQSRTAFLKTALQGALGASIFSFIGLLTLESLPFAIRVTTRTLINALIVRVGIMIGMSTLGILILARKERKLHRQIDLFLFKDYVHSDKL